MLWENLKTKIATYVAQRPQVEGCEYIQREADAAKLSVPAYLDTVDIRNVAKLRSLVPAAFPKTLRSGAMLCAFINERGAWCVEKEQPK